MQKQLWSMRECWLDTKLFTRCKRDPVCIGRHGNVLIYTCHENFIAPEIDNL